MRVDGFKIGEIKIGTTLDIVGIGDEVKVIRERLVGGHEAGIDDSHRIRELKSIDTLTTDRGNIFPCHH